MTEGPLLPQMLAFTLPFVLANLLQTLYTIADMSIIGHFATEVDLAAVSISGQVTILLTLIGASVANAGQIYIAQLIGQKRRQDLKITIGTFLSLTAILAVIVTVLSCVLRRGILTWINTPAEAMGPAIDYLLVCCIGMVFVFGYNAVCAILRGMGESKAPTVFVAVTAALNVIGDLILVAGMGMGALGAALATAISQGVAFVLSLAFLHRRREEAGFDFRRQSFAIRREPLWIIVKLALPLVIMQLAINLSMLYVNSYINFFGISAASLAGIGNKLYSVVNMVTSAFGAAMATIVGQNIGAGNIGRVRKALMISTVINLCFFALVSALALLFPRAMFAIFTNETSVLDLAPQYLRIAIWAYLGFALMQPMLGLINGVGNTTLNLVIGVLDGVVARIGLSLLLGGRFGMWGYFWGYCLAGMVSVLLSWAYFFSGRWKNRKLL